MANKLYGSFKDKLCARQLQSLDTYQYQALLLDSSYVFDDTHSTVNDIPATSIVAQSLINNTVLTGHTLDGDNTLFSGVTGNQITQIVVATYSTDNSLTHLIAHIDTGTGLPITPNGDSIVIVWSDSVNRIFTL